MVLTTEKLTQKDKLVTLLASHSSDFLNPNRKAALERLAEIEVPTTRNEYWKYTRIAKYLNVDFALSEHKIIDNINQYKLFQEAVCIIFVDGKFQKHLSDNFKQEGIHIKSIAAAKTENSDTFSTCFSKQTANATEFFTLLNDSFCDDGYFIEVEEGKVLEKPIHILSVTNSENSFLNSRNLLVVGKNAQAKVIQSFHTLSGTSFINSVTETIVKENAVVEQVLIQNESSNASQINTIEVYQEKLSTYSITTASLGGKFIRNNLTIVVDGEFCETNLSGYYRCS